MKENGISFFGKYKHTRFVFTILLFLISTSIQATYVETITAAITKHLADKTKFPIHDCATPPAETAYKIPKCSICYKDLNEAQKSFTIIFMLGDKKMTLSGNNVDVTEADEDFEFKVYVESYQKESESILTDDALKAKLDAVLAEGIETLGIKPLENQERVFVIGDEKNPKGNKAIKVTLDLANQSMTYTTNFFSNTYSLSLRHTKYVENEIRRAWKQVITALKLMNGLLGNTGAERTTTTTISCKSALGNEDFKKELTERVTKLGWTATVGEESIEFTKSDKVPETLSCKEVNIENRLPLVHLTLSSKDKKINLSQAFFKNSMYDLNGLVRYFVNDALTQLVRFYEKNNVEENVDFGKKSLFEGAQTGVQPEGEEGEVKKEGPKKEGDDENQGGNPGEPAGDKSVKDQTDEVDGGAGGRKLLKQVKRRELSMRSNPFKLSRRIRFKRYNMSIDEDAFDSKITKNLGESYRRSRHDSYLRMGSDKSTKQANNKIRTGRVEL